MYVCIYKSQLCIPNDMVLLLQDCVGIHLSKKLLLVSGTPNRLFGAMMSAKLRCGPNFKFQIWNPKFKRLPWVADRQNLTHC